MELLHLPMNRANILLLWSCLSINMLFAIDSPIGAYDPNGPSPFKVPVDKDEVYKSIVDYRKNFSKMTGIEFSGLHWNMGAVVYINMDSSVYINNHIVHLQTLMSDDEDDDDGEFGDEDEFEEDEFEDEEEEPKNKPLHFRVGTIIVKENYVMSGANPVAPSFLTIMVKRKKGYDPKLGDWQYLQINADGTEILNDKGSNQAVVTSCTECHANISQRDYIFSTYYTKIQPSGIFKK